MQQTTSQIDFFAIIELMGHQKIAGKVTEQAIAGTNMLRVDVPEIGNQPAFTRYIGGAGIYAINPCTEEVLMAFLKNNAPEPVYAWDVLQMIKADRLRLTMPEAPECERCDNKLDSEFPDKFTIGKDMVCKECFEEWKNY